MRLARAHVVNRVCVRVFLSEKKMTMFKSETAEGGTNETSLRNPQDFAREAPSESAAAFSGKCFSVEASPEPRSGMATSGGPVGGPHGLSKNKEEEMPGLFVLNYWKEEFKLGEQLLFANNLKGALRKATQLIAKSAMKDDLTIAVLYAKEHNLVRKRRFYFNGEPISPWINFEDAIDEY